MLHAWKLLKLRGQRQGRNVKNNRTPRRFPKVKLNTMWSHGKILNCRGMQHSELLGYGSFQAFALEEELGLFTLKGVLQNLWRTKARFGEREVAACPATIPVERYVQPPGQMFLDPPRAGIGGQGHYLKGVSPDICRVFSSMRFPVMAGPRGRPPTATAFGDGRFLQKIGVNRRGSAKSARNGKTVHDLRASFPAEYFFAGSSSRLTSKPNGQNSPHTNDR